MTWKKTKMKPWSRVTLETVKRCGRNKELMNSPKQDPKVEARVKGRPAATRRMRNPDEVRADEAVI